MRAIAVSLVTDLFLPPYERSGLATALACVIDGGDLAIVSRFQATVVGRATQSLFKRWKETDPLSARLWRRLRYTVRHDSRLCAFPSESPEWVTLAASAAQELPFKVLDYSDVRRLVRELGASRPSTGDLIVRVLEEAGGDPSQACAARLDDLFASIREIEAHFAAERLSALPHTTNENPSWQLDLQHAVEKARQRRNEILRKYLADGKLTSEMADAFLNALDDIIEDEAGGGVIQSYFQYLAVHHPNLERAGYRREYRTRFEYLAGASLAGLYDGFKE